MSGAALDLVVQGPSLREDDLPSLLALAGATRGEALDRGLMPAFRLRAPQVRERVIDACRTRGLDAAFVPRERRLDRVRVVALDMDSTLIDVEVVDEIAAMRGLRDRVAAITERTMRGEIDFGRSLAQRVALFAGLPADALARVHDDRVRLSPGAEWMIAGFAAAGAKVGILSGGFTCFADRLRGRLALDFSVANVLDVENGALTGRIRAPLVDAAAKADALARLRTAHAGPDGIVVAIGDGANDLAMMREADVSIAWRAKPVVRAQATHAIDFGGLDAALNLFA